MSATRVFTRDELEKLDVPWTHIHDETWDSTRWTEIRRCVFRTGDGKTYRVSYETGLTEFQNCDLWDDETEITAEEVELREVTITRWEAKP